MPLKGINLGPGSTPTKVNSDHWWFEQWEEKGDYPLRYFLEPAVLTANYAFANGYEKISMSGLSGGGWSTTFASAIDKRISASFPIAGSVPCAMRNPNGKVRSIHTCACVCARACVRAWISQGGINLINPFTSRECSLLSG